MFKMFSENVQKINEREFRFICDPQSPIPDAIEALSLVISELSQIQAQQKAMLAQQEQEKSKEEII